LRLDRLAGLPYTPTQVVVAFRQNKANLAENSRVTNVVIDNYNQPERYSVDFWVLIYGKITALITTILSENEIKA